MKKKAIYRILLAAVLLWSIEEISIDKGRTEWGAPEGEDVFIIKLKERIE